MMTPAMRMTSGSMFSTLILVPDTELDFGHFGYGKPLNPM
jgi:hypothetical protein